MALIRLVRKKPELWGRSMQTFLLKFSESIPGQNRKTIEIIITKEVSCNNNDGHDDEDDDDVSKLVDDAGRVIKQIFPSFTQVAGRDESDDGGGGSVMGPEIQPVYKKLFFYVLQNYIKYTGPLFQTSGRVEVGKCIQLHFFEPRYRTMIAEVMEPFPDSFKRGNMIDPNHTDANIVKDVNNGQFKFPSFLYANNSLKRRKIIYIVHVQRCLIHGDGRADVILKFECPARIEEVWVRPESTEYLFESRVIKTNLLEIAEEHKNSILQRRRKGSFFQRFWSRRIY